MKAFINCWKLTLIYSILVVAVGIYFQFWGL